MDFTFAICLTVFYGLITISSLIACVWAYSKCRRSGWLLLVAASLIEISVVLVSPAMERARREAWSAKVERSGAGPKPAYPFPFERIISAFGAVIFTAGLWRIAAGETRKDSDQALQRTGLRPAAELSR